MTERTPNDAESVRDTAEGSPPGNSRSILRSPWLWAVVIGMVVLPLLRPFLRNVPDPPPVVGPIPSYELVDASGAAYGSADNEGYTYILNFFFTSCPSLCPRLMSAMAELRSKFDEAGLDIRLVSVTVDPETDDPATLRAYARSQGIEGEGSSPSWILATGPLEEIEALAFEGFASEIGAREEIAPDVFDIAHAGKLYLIDPRGNLRGRPDEYGQIAEIGYGTDERSLDELLHRAIHVHRQFDTRGR